MQLTEQNTYKQIMTIIKGDFRDGDDVERTYHYSNEQFDFIAPLLIVIQDLYNHKHDLNLNNKDIREDIDEFITEYFKKYTNMNIKDIHEYADSWITDELYDCIPHLYLEGWSYPLHSLSIQIIKNGELYKLEKEQSQETISQAQQTVLNWLKQCATKQ